MHQVSFLAEQVDAFKKKKRSDNDVDAQEIPVMFFYPNDLMLSEHQQIFLRTKRRRLSKRSLPGAGLSLLIRAI